MPRIDPSEPPELQAQAAWLNRNTPDGLTGSRLESINQAWAQYLEDSRVFHENKWRVQREEKNSRAKSEEDRTEGKEPRWYFGTFTQPNTNTDPHEILKNTAKLIKSKMVSPIEWCYSLELQQSGTPHTHYAFLTHKYPEYKKIHAFNCSKLKILQRSKTEPARNAEHAIRYVLKTDTKPDANWLAEHNLSQTEWLSDNCPQPA